MLVIKKRLHLGPVEKNKLAVVPEQALIEGNTRVKQLNTNITRIMARCVNMGVTRRSVSNRAPMLQIGIGVAIKEGDSHCSPTSKIRSRGFVCAQLSSRFCAPAAKFSVYFFIRYFFFATRHVSL